MRIVLKNEDLDLQADALVTFKKSQQLNGLQDQYSYSNNLDLQNSSKNRRLLGINYLPNSKAKSMTIGYDVDVVFNGCIYLKRQKLKVQKESADSIPSYLIFTDNYFIVKAKEVLMNQVDTGVTYTKTLANFITANEPVGTTEMPYRTAPVSAQDQSGLVVVEEVPILLNAKYLLLTALTEIGYTYVGDILTDENIGKYYTSSNVGIYGPNGTPTFDNAMSVYDFVISFLKTFNGYIEVSDSARTIGVYFWKNIETLKDNFVDYSSKFVNFTEYTFEGGLAKINNMSYASSPAFYNGFFNNNKSIIDKTDYLKSDFGAGSLRLFDDQDLEEDGTLPLREVGEVSDPQTLNLFRFEEGLSQMPVYFEGVSSFSFVYKAYSPNILEIWQLFHEAYTKNISLPTTGLFNFRYDAIFLSNFKMHEVFFIKQLSTYWLPLELAYTSKKDGIKVKCLMIEKTAVDIPIVFDQSIAIDFYGSFTIADIFALYSAANTSPAATMTITSALLDKNNIFVNGIQILAFPTNIDVSTAFEIRIENIEPDNVISNSDIIFTFTSQEGGTSLPGKINVAHNGRANFVSEFRSELDESVGYRQENVPSFVRYLNYSAKITTPINIVNTLAPLIGDVGTPEEGTESFKMLKFARASNVTVELSIDSIGLDAFTYGSKTAVTKINFIIRKNGADLLSIYSLGVTDTPGGGFARVEEFDIFRPLNFTAAVDDEITAYAYLESKPGSGPFPTTLDGSVFMTNVNWKFKVSEQI